MRLHLARGVQLKAGLKIPHSPDASCDSEATGVVGGGVAPPSAVAESGDMHEHCIGGGGNSRLRAQSNVWYNRPVLSFRLLRRTRGLPWLMIGDQWGEMKF